MNSHDVVFTVAGVVQDVDEVLFNALLDTCCRLKEGISLADTTGGRCGSFAVLEYNRSAG